MDRDSNRGTQAAGPKPHGQQPGRPRRVYRAGGAPPAAAGQPAPPAGQVPAGQGGAVAPAQAQPPQGHSPAARPVAGVDYMPPPPPRPPKPKLKPRKWTVLVAFLLVVVLGGGLGVGLALGAKGELTWPFGGASSASLPATSVPALGSRPGTSSLPPVGDEGLEGWIAGLAPAAYAAKALPDEMRAMWFAFLEWEAMDFGSEEAFRTAVGGTFATCADMGLNTVIVAVRPFGDALYESSLYPWSHVMNGTQGQAPDFDPLRVMTEEAHSRGLRLEAWVNPYRVRGGATRPAALSNDNPAAQNPAWVRSVGEEQWYDPGLPEVEELVVKGVAEIVQNYEVDGIHFDDYFYPSGADDSFDAETFAQYGEGLDRTAWRLENVSRMVRLCRAAVKAANPTASFGISVQGNNTANYSQMYADVNRWMAEEGYLDYVMPQIYWGFGHVDAAGKTVAAFDNKVAEWAGYERLDSVRLYAGLAAYRIGLLQADGTRADFGGNGAGDNSEWSTGYAMATQVEYLRGNTGFSGFALFRYDYMVQPNDPVSQSEIAALTALLAG